ncbi:protein DEHYDRATION-INDUCED 19 homolog 6-like isoform X2 [Actinidia eriantha]|uniref:protein DEHYDRATION-INDUCED 19 homolog 6-like isoform X2 n=1 Tax=Actinidia eriantha TaxID=165200 RepID=UPI00258F81CC|nr:protein DEHYDRATION-INDUCED 19 homolog 6-like isoform X2 [Actinidia eriantha]
MDVDMWASRVHSAKHLSVLQAARLNHNTEGEDDTRAYFPCPYCYVEIELHVLCSHLKEEHCFDLKNAVCPLCAANLGKDAIGHFMVQHAHVVKRREKNQKPDIWSNSSTMLGKDLRGLSSFLGSSTMSGKGNMHNSAPDPLLSPFICNVPLSDLEGNLEDECSGNAASTTFDVTSIVPARGDEIQEQDYEERRQRAAFFQQLILSTIF